MQLGQALYLGKADPAAPVLADGTLRSGTVQGSVRAVELRSELSATMSKVEIAMALREAREWMTMH